MKTWEMYKMALLNQVAKFKRVSDGKIYHFNEGGRLISINTEEFKCESIDEDWELVPQEVTWQEAIQAWIDGKNIHIEYNGKIYIQRTNYRLGCFMEMGTDGIDERIFRKGKWYIE